MRICFWGKIADALKGKTLGGGELQIALLARTLAGLGHEVVVVDLDIQEGFQTPEGIMVYPVKGYKRGIRMLRTFTHRLPGLYSTFVDLKADIYYCRIREYRHILVYLAARKVNAKFVLALASDLDILTIAKRWKHFYSSNIKDLWGVFNGLSGEIVYPFLLRKADMILVQHKGQEELLMKKGITSVGLPNMIEMLHKNIELTETKGSFVYVGSLDKRKGFGKFYELVERTPGYNYKVIGSPRDETGSHYYDKLRTFKNVELKGRLSHEETLRDISSSLALISTSPMEGFPNIFIEAWACGIQVLSLYVDPGGVIQREKLGVVSDGDMGKLIASMGTICKTEEFSRRARIYVQEHHELNAARIGYIDSIIKSLLK
jgi:glycosyltransferase involved in cell wall biosynthesis